ncbi:hypothetical protein J6590_093232, partial [Homalodisca vitripennis]
DVSCRVLLCGCQYSSPYGRNPVVEEIQPAACNKTSDDQCCEMYGLVCTLQAERSEFLCVPPPNFEGIFV